MQSDRATNQMPTASKQGSLRRPVRCNDRLEPIRQFSGWVRDQNDMGVAYPNITAEVKSRVARMQIPQLRERANRALLALIKKGCRIGTEISPYMSHAPDLQGRTCSKDADELIALLHILCDDGLLTDGPSWSLNSRALIAAEDLSFGGGSSAQGFVAMSFNSTIDDAWTTGSTRQYGLRVSARCGLTTRII